MPPKAKKKAEASKKNQEKKKKGVVSDMTFGLKNKNKSKKVQMHVQAVTKSVYNVGPGARKEEEKKKKAQADRKAKKKAEKAEQNALFGEALKFGKKKDAALGTGKVEAKGRDHGDDDKQKAGTSRAMKMMFQMDAKEMADKLKEDPNYVPTLEDEIEAQRQAMVEKLKASGKKGTPVTPETFAAWQERKRKRHADTAKKMVEAEFKKKKGGKGLSVLSGKDLFEYRKELFEDDDEALAGIAEESAPPSRADSGVGGEAEEGAGGEEKKSADGGGDGEVEAVTKQVQSDLFLEGDSDDDLDDLDDLEED